jgi:multiple sugar transport system substrate-binding protein
MTALRLVSWGHRRATAPLRAAVESFRLNKPDVEIAVDDRSLRDFEHQGIAGVAEQYDLIVFDHPFCGDIAKGRLFLPLEERLPELLGRARDSLYLGPSLDT